MLAPEVRDDLAQHLGAAVHHEPQRALHDERGDLVDVGVLLDRPVEAVEEEADLLRVERAVEEVHGAERERLLHAPLVAVARDRHHRHALVVGAQTRQEVEPLHARELEVEENGLGPHPARELLGLDGVARLERLEAAAQRRALEPLAHPGVLLDDQEPGRAGGGRGGIEVAHRRGALGYPGSGAGGSPRGAGRGPRGPWRLRGGAGPPRCVSSVSRPVGRRSPR
jgi:hypothetical protein